MSGRSTTSVATIAAAASAMSLWAAMGERPFIRAQWTKGATRELLAGCRGQSKVLSRHIHIARSAASHESPETVTAEEDVIAEDDPSNKRSAAAAVGGLISSIRYSAARPARRSVKRGAATRRRNTVKDEESIEKESDREVKKEIVNVEAELADAVKELRVETAATLKGFRKALLTFRIGGEASVDHIKDIVIDRRGSYVTLKELGTISVIDDRTLEVKCSDEAMVEAIAKSLSHSNLSFDVIVNGEIVSAKVKSGDVNTMRKYEMYEAMANHLDAAKEAISRAGASALKRIEDVEEAGGPTSEEVERIVNEAREEAASMDTEKTRQIAFYASPPEDSKAPGAGAAPEQSFVDV